MGKAKRAEKKARKKNKELEAELEAAEERTRTRRTVVLAAIPLVTLAAAAVCLWVYEASTLAGAVLLGGALFWLMAGLGFLGSSIRPRDRQRAGSIDFGQRR